MELIKPVMALVSLDTIIQMLSGIVGGSIPDVGTYMDNLISSAITGFLTIIFIGNSPSLLSHLGVPSESGTFNVDDGSFNFPSTDAFANYISNGVDNPILNGVKDFLVDYEPTTFAWVALLGFAVFGIIQYGLASLTMHRVLQLQGEQFRNAPQPGANTGGQPNKNYKSSILNGIGLFVNAIAFLIVLCGATAVEIADDNEVEVITYLLSSFVIVLTSWATFFISLLNGGHPIITVLAFIFCLIASGLLAIKIDAANAKYEWF